MSPSGNPATQGGARLGLFAGSIVFFGPLALGNLAYFAVKVVAATSIGADAEGALRVIARFVPALSNSTEDIQGYSTNWVEIVPYLASMYLGTLVPLTGVLAWLVVTRLGAWKRGIQFGSESAGKLDVYAIYCLPVAALVFMDFIFGGGFLKVAANPFAILSPDRTNSLIALQVNGYFLAIWWMSLLAGGKLIAVVMESLRKIARP